MNALQIRNFTKKFGEFTAVDNVSLSIPEGEFFGLLGPNGAGKTTTIQCITGIGKLNQGDIEVFGNNVRTDYQKARQLVGLSPQEFNVDIFATPEKILDYSGGYFGMPETERKEKIAELLESFDLTEHAKKVFQKLSGGMKRRVILARALMHSPKLLILDEPTAGVDVEQRRQMWEYLQAMHQSGKTIILTSHYLEEVEFLCSRVAIIHKGKIAKILTKEEFSSNGERLEKLYLKITESKYE